MARSFIISFALTAGGYAVQGGGRGASGRAEWGRGRGNARVAILVAAMHDERRRATAAVAAVAAVAAGGAMAVASTGTDVFGPTAEGGGAGSGSSGADRSASRGGGDWPGRREYEGGIAELPAVQFL